MKQKSIFNWSKALMDLFQSSWLLYLGEKYTVSPSIFREVPAHCFNTTPTSTKWNFEKMYQIMAFRRVLGGWGGGGTGGTLDFKWQGRLKDFFGFEIFHSGLFLGGLTWPHSSGNVFFQCFIFYLISFYF